MPSSAFPLRTTAGLLENTALEMRTIVTGADLTTEALKARIWGQTTKLRTESTADFYPYPAKFYPWVALEARSSAALARFTT